MGPWVSRSESNTMQGFKGSRSITDEIYKDWYQICQSHWSLRYRSRSSGQGVCWLNMLRRNTIIGSKVIVSKVDETATVDVKFVKVIGV